MIHVRTCFIICMIGYTGVCSRSAALRSGSRSASWSSDMKTRAVGRRRERAAVPNFPTTNGEVRPRGRVEVRVQAQSTMTQCRGASVWVGPAVACPASSIMQSTSRALPGQSPVKIYNAVYSSVQVDIQSYFRHTLDSHIFSLIGLRVYGPWYCRHASTVGLIRERNSNPQSRRHRQRPSHENLGEGDPPRQT